MGGKEIEPAEDILYKADVPNYRFPEVAVRTIRAMVDYRAYLNRPADRVIEYPAEKAAVQAMFDKVLADGRYQLGEVEASEVFRLYGIPVAGTRLATNLEECITAGREIGYPVVAKIASPQILHKTDVGGVKVGLQNTDDLITAYEEITANARRLMPEAQIWGVVVQEMLKPSKELIVGMNRDPQFGPLIMVGLGGIYVEVIKDISFRLAPVGERDSMEMIKELKSYWLLLGARGETPADVAKLAEIIQRVSQLVSDFPIIQELDINPLRVFDKDKGCVAADARMIIGE
jgi:acyl-CoA synthetase (NDP forming)